MNQRRDATGLIGIGIILLLLSGLGFSPASKGFLGIDIFFVVAGYLGTKELLTEYRKNAKHNRGYGSVSLSAYYGRRMLYPVVSALLALGVIAFAVRFTNDLEYINQVSMDAIWAAFMLANVNFMHQGVDFLASTSKSSPILNYWAVSTYTQVMLIYPLLVLSALGFKKARIKNKRVRHRKRAIYALGTIAIVAIVVTAVEQVLEPKTAMFTASARLADFAIGGFFAAIRINELNFGRMQLVLTRLGALMILGFSPFLFNGVDAHIASAVIAIAAGFLLASHSKRLPDIFSTVFGAWPLYGIGLIATQIFLWYWPILVLAHRYGFHLGYEGGALERAGLSILIIGVSTVTHIIITKLILPLTVRVNASGESIDVPNEHDDNDADEPEKSEADLSKPKSKTVYQYRNSALALALTGTAALAIVSAPTLIAPPETSPTAIPTTSASSTTNGSDLFKPRAVFLGASITFGRGAVDVPGWSKQAAVQLGWNLTNLAKPGTGFTHGNKLGVCAGNNCPSIADMAITAITKKPDVVVISGGLNDCSAALKDAPRAQTAINQTFNSLRRGLPYTPIIAMSVIQNKGARIPECYARINTWIASAAENNQIAFIPDVSQWIAGKPELLSKDRIHPNDAGHTEIARRFVMWFRQQNIRVEPGVQ